VAWNAELAQGSAIELPDEISNVGQPNAMNMERHRKRLGCIHEYPTPQALLYTSRQNESTCL
jgi:hypothetical protein